jgi:muconate cycloisomerase
LEPFGISAVEQPVPHEEADRLADVRRKVRTPIMLDESLCGRVDAERAIDRATCDLFNLRLSKCGGFIPTLELARLAKRSGLGYQLGCQVGETALLSAAGRHFATSVGGIRYLEGSYDRYLVRERLAREDITFSWGGWAPALNKGGLGVTIAAEDLARITVRKEPIVG